MIVPLKTKLLFNYFPKYLSSNPCNAFPCLACFNGDYVTKLYDSFETDKIKKGKL